MLTPKTFSIKDFVPPLHNAQWNIFFHALKSTDMKMIQLSERPRANVCLDKGF